MAYATIQNLIDRFTVAELKSLAPLIPAGDPGYDAVRVQQVLDDASAEIDSYLAVRFAVPLTDTPPLIEKAACDLAREGLDRTGRAHVLETGKRTRAWLKDVAQGRAALGAGADGDPASLPEPEAGGLEVMAPDRVFDDAGLEGYLR